MSEHKRALQGNERQFRHMRCPECQRVASVPNWCARPVCVHGSDGCTPEVWDGDDPHGLGRPIEWSENEVYRTPGPHTWTAMVPMEPEAEALAEALEVIVKHGGRLPAIKALDAYRARHPKEST